ncbi:MAG: fused MFS/spermidine synthase, partial [Candidatus Cloacimonetes bacterium]|nr:fused MFS/spermidine synthase [Candidatus Cloacimonadota bacterium]
MKLLLILILFYFSGAIGLGYQVLWSKFLLEFIGVSAYSYAAILCVFMTGLALGSQLLGKVSDRLPCSLKFYCGLEIGIGLYTILLYEPLMMAAGQFYQTLAAQILLQSDSTFVLIPLRILLAASVLLPPAIAMGATFPAVLRYATEFKQQIGQKAASLYAWNALGAASGSLVMAFLVIPTLGLKASLMSLGLGNLALAFMAYIISGIWPSTAPQNEKPLDNGEEQIRLKAHWLGFIFLTGFLSFCLEIAWTRYFILVLGSSTYSFAIVLSCFIFGIFLGSQILKLYLHKITPQIFWLGLTMVFTGALLLISLHGYPYLPSLSKFLNSLLISRDSALFLSEGFKIFLCVLIMLPPTIFIGMSIPLFLHMYANQISDLGAISGQVYAINTWGNVLGALTGSLVLLPLLGLEFLFVACGVAYLILGMYCIYQNKPKLLPFLCLGTLVFCVSKWMLPWDMIAFTVVPTRKSDGMTFKDVFLPDFKSSRVLFYAEDPAASIIVISRGEGENQSRSLLVNGKADASDQHDMPTQIMLGQTPLLLHKDPKEVLIVGFGSGVTVGAALTHPVSSVEVVELAASVIEASHLFDHVNNQPLSDPRTKVIIEDAASYLTTTPKHYDVIISEPSNPWIAGVGSLFSLEFYQKAQKRLNPEGIFLQWLQAYEISDQTLSTIYATFHAVFPYIHVFSGTGGDLLLLGTLSPLKPDLDKIRSQMQDPKIQASLKIAERPTIEDFFQSQLFSPKKVALIASLAKQLNTRDNLWIEYNAPKELFLRASPALLAREDERINNGVSLLNRTLGVPYPSLESMQKNITEQGSMPTVFRNHITDAMLSLKQHFQVDSLDRMQIMKRYFGIQYPLGPDYTMELLSGFLESDEILKAKVVLSNRFHSVMLQARYHEGAKQAWLNVLDQIHSRYHEKIPQASLFYAALLNLDGQTENALNVLQQIPFPVPSNDLFEFLELTEQADTSTFVNRLLEYKDT